MGSGIGFAEGEGPGPFVEQAVALPGDFQIHSHLGPVIDLGLIHSAGCRMEGLQRRLHRLDVAMATFHGGCQGLSAGRRPAAVRPKDLAPQPWRRYKCIVRAFDSGEQPSPGATDHGAAAALCC